MSAGRRRGYAAGLWMSNLMPHFSVIIAVYNDWEPIEQCLRSLGQQVNAPEFEVIVVDDGSDQEAPQSIRNWNERFPIGIVRQQHSGISAARNRGIQTAKGSILVFTDADCEMESECLSVLAAAASSIPQCNCFQLHLAGEQSNLLGRAEELRLMSIQQHAVRPDGRIRYLNTAGFAIRRASVGANQALFDPFAERAEDTLLLADLIRRGELPFFVPNAIVRHRINLSLLSCLVKDVRSAWREGATYDKIAAQGVSVRMSDAARLRMMGSMWDSSKQDSIGRTAWFVTVARRTVHRLVRSLYKALRGSVSKPQ